MRNPGIDVLRAVAVLLVLGRHARWPRHWLADAWQRGGWVGVDLFFVLSGFLVSGLLFAQFEKTGKIGLRRFVARRFLRIYPAFLCLIVFTLSFNRATGAGPFEWHRLLAELLLVQNYAPAMWGHTWSLAVEMHFYLLLPLLLWACRANRFRRLPIAIGFACAALLLVRCFNYGTFEVMRNVFATHLRFDSLLFGVLLAYFCRHHQARFQQVAAHTWWLAGLGGLLLAPAFIWPLEQTWWVCTLGFTSFYLGSGCLLAAVLGRKLPENLLTRYAAEIGRHSYSIYLWHAALVAWVYTQATWLDCASYIVASILVGVIFSKCFELPSQRLRDLLLPTDRRTAPLASGLPA